MNGFHSCWRGISAHDSASTMGKKIANWTVGKSTLRSGRLLWAVRRYARTMRQSTRRVSGKSRQGWGVAALAAALVAFALVPAAAGADCGGVHRAKPSQK